MQPEASETPDIDALEISADTRPVVHVCLVQGSDADGLGTEKMPFKSLERALVHAKGPADCQFHVRKQISDNYALVAKAALKKAVKMYEVNVRKQAKLLERSAADLENEQKQAQAVQARLQESKNIVLTMDVSLPAPVRIRIKDATAHRMKRVKISGWVHRLRVQGKDMMFVVLRDGYGHLQCVLTGSQCHTYHALTLTAESSIAIYGVIKEVPEGKQTPGGHELICDYWELLGASPGGDEAFNNKLNIVKLILPRNQVQIFYWTSVIWLFVEMLRRHASRCARRASRPSANTLIPNL